MAIEAKELIEYLGYSPDDIDSIDTLKSKFSTEFIRRDAVVKDKTLVSTVTGMVTGSTVSKIISAAKDLGVALEEEEVKGKKLEDVVSLFSNKTKDFYGAKITDLETLVSTNNKDDIVKQLEEKVKKLEAKNNDVTKLLDTTKQEYEGKIGQYENEKKTFKINTRKSEALKKVQFKDGLTELERKGFMTIIEEEIDVDLDESGNPFPINKKDKSRIPNPKVTGTFMDFEDIYNQKAIELKLAKVTPTNQPPVVRTVVTTPATVDEPPKRQLAKDKPGFKPMVG